MVKWFGLAIFWTIFVWEAGAQSLSFRSDGTFKILQFTDTHICAEKTESQDGIRTIRTAMEVEKPDLIVFTGDVVTGKPARKGWEMVMEPIAQSGIPFCVVLGNHDDEQDISRQEIAKIITAYPNNRNVVETDLLADFTLPVSGSVSGTQKALLYFMDSHAYSTIDTVKGYGWFTFDQVEWYRNTSANYTRQNGGKPFPALAFFHIPLPEYTTAFDTKKNYPTGQRLEKECSPRINTGMFAAFLESGDVMGTFVGHDHNNDYVAPLYRITLCYGRFTGGKTTYTDIPNGVRVIELREDQRGFTTWIREKGSKVLDRTVCGEVRQPVWSRAFSHNDYERPRPLFDALGYGYNNVEADIHLIDGKLFVSHDTPGDTTQVKTLEDQYLRPLWDLIARNKGYVYSNGEGPFYLMIDFKTEGESTYTALHSLLEKYKDMLCRVEDGIYKEGPVLIFLSGDKPVRTISDQSSRQVFLDGRITDLGKKYPASLMPVISNNFREYFQWNGVGEMPGGELKLLRSFVKKAHQEGKKLRFWAVPDTEVAKRLLLKENLDLVGEDRLDNLYRILEGGIK